MKTVLLTGFPAPRAHQILRELGERDADSRVLLLVHPARADEATVALSELSSKPARVELVAANPAALDFGLRGSEYLALANDVGVVHAAYSVTHSSVAETLAERINVGAARELVEFSRAARRLEKLVLYSSVFVSGQRSGVVRESELEAGQLFRNPVDRTLATAERMLRRSGAPLVTLRAGYLLRETGADPAELDLGPYFLMALVVSAPEDAPLPMVPGAEAVVPLTTLEYLARLGVFAARAARARTTLHAVEFEPLTLQQLLALVGERCGRRAEPGLNPALLTRFLVGNPATRLLPQSARGVFEVLSSDTRYATEELAELVRLGAPAPRPLSDYVDVLLSSIREHMSHAEPAPERPRSAPYHVA
jgi:hypothetical protein